MMYVNIYVIKVVIISCYLWLIYDRKLLVISMKTLSIALEKPFLEAVRSRALSSQEESEYLKWLRYYLDFCAKYKIPPRDHDSLSPFLQKLASKKQTLANQERAAASVALYYGLITEWRTVAAAGDKCPISVDLWDPCYRKLKEEIALRHYSPKTLQAYRVSIRPFQV